MNEKIVWIFLGIPMCGKGLTGLILKDLYTDITLWVMRTLIGCEKKRNAEFATLADTHERAGTLIPNSEVDRILEQSIDFRHGDLHVIDGGGRNHHQMRFLLRLLRLQGVTDKCIRVIHFKMTKADSMDRFHKKRDAADRQNRKDADPEVHESRIDSHLKEEPRILAYLQNKGISICEIDAASDDVHAKISRILDNAGLKHSDTGMLQEVIRQHLPEDVEASTSCKFVAA